MKTRLACISLLVLLLVFSLAGSALASVCVNVGDMTDLAINVPDIEVDPALTRPPLTVNPMWQRIDGLDKLYVSLVAGGPSTIVNFTLPSGVRGTVSWMSLNPNVATVVANSPARITPVGVGKTWVVAVVKTDEETLYDAVLVEVVAALTAPAAPAAPATPLATPPTSGGISAVLIGVLALTASIPFIRMSRSGK